LAIKDFYEYLGGLMTRCILRKIVLLSGLLLTVGSLTAQTNTQFTINDEWARGPEGEWDGATSWVAADGKGNVLVMVRQSPYFRLFDRDGHFLESWGAEGLYRNAHSVTYDNQGNIWATGAARHIVDKFSPEGELLMSLGRVDQAGDNGSHYLFNQENHVFVTHGGDIYITDGYKNSRVIQFNGQGQFVRIIGGIKCSCDGELDTPHGVAVDSRGRILVNDSGNQRVAVFSAQGEFVESWPFPSRGGIVVMPDDTVYVSDVNAGAVNVIRDGELLDTISVDARPHGLAVDSDGSIYVSDARGRKVIKFSPR